MKVVTEEHRPDNEALVMQLVFGDEGAVVVYRDAEGAAVAVVPGGKAARFPSWPAGAIGPALIVPAHFQNAGPPRVIIGLRTFAPVGEMKLVVDDVAIYWAARK